MTKQEFLSRLKESLENGLDGRAVQENMDYYRSYIEEEAGQGRSEEAVVEELGDPWVIAQSVINMAESRAAAEAGYVHGNGSSGNSGRRGYSDTQVHNFMVSNWWKRLLFLLGIIGIVLIVFAVIGGLISLVMPLVLPILVILMVIRLFRRMR